MKALVRNTLGVLSMNAASNWTGLLKKGIQDYSWLGFTSSSLQAVCSPLPFFSHSTTTNPPYPKQYTLMTGGRSGRSSSHQGVPTSAIEYDAFRILFHWWRLSGHAEWVNSHGGEHRIYGYPIPLNYHHHPILSCYLLWLEWSPWMCTWCRLSPPSFKSLKSHLLNASSGLSLDDSGLLCFTIPNSPV